MTSRRIAVLENIGGDPNLVRRSSMIKARMAAGILRHYECGVPLRAIHDGLPGATWAVINDTLTDAWWKAFSAGSHSTVRRLFG